MLHVIAVYIHLLGACVWVGGHLVLSCSVLPRALRRRDPSIITTYEGLYERIGLPALLAQVLSGFYLAHSWAGAPLHWIAFDTPAGRHVGYKLILLLVTVALAVHARLFLIPRLDARTLPLLGVHIVAVTLVGLLFVWLGIGFRFGLMR